MRAEGHSCVALTATGLRAHVVKDAGACNSSSPVGSSATTRHAPPPSLTLSRTSHTATPAALMAALCLVISAAAPARSAAARRVSSLLPVHSGSGGSTLKKMCTQSERDEPGGRAVGVSAPPCTRWRMQSHLMCSVHIRQGCTWLPVRALWKQQGSAAAGAAADLKKPHTDTPESQQHPRPILLLLLIRLESRILITRPGSTIATATQQTCHPPLLSLHSSSRQPLRQSSSSVMAAAAAWGALPLYVAASSAGWPSWRTRPRM